MQSTLAICRAFVLYGRRLGRRRRDLEEAAAGRTAV